MAAEGVILVQCQGQWLALVDGVVVAVGNNFDDVWSRALVH
ncbi:DUF5678 domain-containing protein [Desulfofundulus salinus]|nr:DUF5678 domain-containing protein [Desulfofundulus salinum]